MSSYLQLPTVFSINLSEIHIYSMQIVFPEEVQLWSHKHFWVDQYNSTNNPFCLLWVWTVHQKCVLNTSCKTARSPQIRWPRVSPCVNVWMPLSPLRCPEGIVNFCPPEIFRQLKNSQGSNGKTSALCLFDGAQEIGGETRRQEERELPTTCHPPRWGERWWGGGGGRGMEVKNARRGIEGTHKSL